MKWAMSATRDRPTVLLPVPNLAKGPKEKEHSMSSQPQQFNSVVGIETCDKTRSLDRSRIGPMLLAKVPFGITSF